MEPVKRSATVGLSRMAKKKGLSTIMEKVSGSGLTPAVATTTAVAAAGASAPSSFKSMQYPAPTC